jgi:hypothetical protein
MLVRACIPNPLYLSEAFLRPDEQRAWQREQQRQADNARAAANARQQQQQRDNDARNQAAARARQKAYDDGIRANRERQEAQQRKAEKDRKAHDDYMKKLRQQGQQTYPYSPPVYQNPVVHPLDGGGTLSGGGSSEKGKGGLGKGILVVICLFVAFAYFGSKSDRSSNPEPAPDAMGSRVAKTLPFVVGPSSPPVGVYTLQPTTTGWQWVPPSGPPVCKYEAVSVITTSQIMRTGQFPTLYPDKYPDRATWGNKQLDRLGSWGFNAAGYASDRSVYNGKPVMNEQSFQTSGFALRDSYPYHDKSLYHNYAGEICGNRYWVAHGGGQIDVFGPTVAADYMAIVNSYAHGCGGFCWDAQTAFILPEEGDAPYGLDTHNGHQDLAVIVLNANPVQTVSGAGGYYYTDKMVYAKPAMRDFLANKYGCAGSADPASGSYCGSGPAASALAALNAAWYGSSVYTTWNTSDAGGIAGIHSGTYASYGTGTGFLDENGTHSLNSATKSSCSTIPDATWGFSATVKTDTQSFVAYFAQVYAQKITAAFAQSSVNPHPPLLMVLYDGPSNVYTAMAPYFQGFWISPSNEPNPADRFAMTQRIIAALAPAPGDPSRALVWADYANAQPDCYTGCTAGGNEQFSSQHAKGAGMVADWQAILALQDVNGKYPVVGIEHWGWYDQVNERWDGGLVSAFADNPYDGSASIATATHANTWQNGHTYAAPSVIWDGTNYEARNFGATPANCTSGGSSPTWATKMGAFTADGSCTWANEGPYTLKPEQVSRTPSTATLPGVAYGDAITPIANFLNAGLCDPVAGKPVMRAPTSATK